MIAFTADNHLGIQAQWSIKERGKDFLESFRDMVDKIMERKGDIHSLIIGGDLFDSSYPPSFAVEFVQRQIGRLYSNGIPTLGIDGNHDIAEGKWLRVCGITPLSEKPTVVAPGLTACGIGFRRSSEILCTLESMADQGVRCDILVLHLALGELNRMGAASDVTASEMLPLLKEMGIRLVLIGHIHVRQSVVIDGIEFAYCGSTETCSMSESREKSVDLVDESSMRISGKIQISSRKIESVVISTEKEFARYEASIVKNSDVLQAMFVDIGIKDGVSRLRELAKSNGLMMRIQTMRQETDAPEEEIDRTTGVIGLEQAIEKTFKSDSVEADLIRTIIRSPKTLKLIVDNFINSGSAEEGNGSKCTH